MGFTNEIDCLIRGSIFNDWHTQGALSQPKLVQKNLSHFSLKGFVIMKENCKISRDRRLNFKNKDILNSLSTLIENI